jgi:hypothetical protein
MATGEGLCPQPEMTALISSSCGSVRSIWRGMPIAGGTLACSGARAIVELFGQFA